MKIEVAPERDDRVVITILPEEGSVPEVKLAEKSSPQPKEELKPEKAEDVLERDPELLALSLKDDPHAQEEIEEARKEKTFRRATEKQIRYFHVLARKAGSPWPRRSWPRWRSTSRSTRSSREKPGSRALPALKL